MAGTERAFGWREGTGGGETDNSILDQTSSPLPEQTVLILQKNIKQHTSGSE